MVYASVCILLMGLAIANVQGEPPEELKKCHHLYRPGVHKCCKDMVELMEKKEEIRECFGNEKPPRGPPSCEPQICLAKKMGYLGSETGTADKAALKQLIETKMANKPELVAAVVKNCVEGDVSKYGPPDFCELHNINKCIKMHSLQACENWEDDEHCTDAKNNIQECIKLFS